MTSHPTNRQCLTHQRVEDQTSPIGLVCPQCKQRLYVQPPRGVCRGYWESQPAAYSIAGEPCFVYTLQWDDFRIRSLHPPGSDVDPRGQQALQAAGQKPPRKRRRRTWR